MSTDEILHHRLPDDPRCPACGAVLDCATPVLGGGEACEPPCDGDFSVCIKCACYLQFKIRDGALVMHRLSEAEFRAVKRDTRRLLQQVRDHTLRFLRRN